MGIDYNSRFLEDLHFHVEVWDRRDMKVERLACATSDLAVAHLAFESVAGRSPDRIVRLRQRSRVMRESLPREGDGSW